jgi:hypothetical protein
MSIEGQFDRQAKNTKLARTGALLQGHGECPVTSPPSAHKSPDTVNGKAWHWYPPSQSNEASSHDSEENSEEYSLEDDSQWDRKHGGCSTRRWK